MLERCRGRGGGKVKEMIEVVGRATDGLKKHDMGASI